MSTLLKTSLAFVAAGLLSTSALASSGAQDTSFLKKDKKHHHEEMKEEKMEKNKFFMIEASYNFNEYKPKFVDKGTTSHDFDDSGTFGAGFGRYINEHVSIHGGLNTLTQSRYQFSAANSSGANSFDSKVNTTKLLVNATYDFGAVSSLAVSPYVTAGMGAAYNQFKTYATRSGVTTYYGDHDWQFAYQVGAGLAYKCPNDMRVNLGYRFADNGEAHKVPNVTTDRLQSHEIVAGLQIPF